MNNKMKKVNVTLEIPVDMEVSYFHRIAPHLVGVNLVDRKPKEILLREVIGVEQIPPNNYYVKEGYPDIYHNMTGGSFPKDPGETVYELVHANTK